MRIIEFKKLEKRITGYNFNKNYKNINMIMTILSYFGNIASIFLAYFFMSKVLGAAITDTSMIFISSIVILSGLELLKRDIFDKFSIQTLKDKSITKTVMPLLIASFLLIFASFYSSISGAKEFSLKSKEIDKQSTKVINVYSDSISNIYTKKIEVFEVQNSEMFDINKKLDSEARDIPINLVNRKLDIRKQIDKNNQQIDKNDLKIKDLKIERDKQIAEYKQNVVEEGSTEKTENSKNSFLFIILSTIIELIILSGVYFNEYYKFRSYSEFKDIIDRDPNYKKWMLYDRILSIIINDQAKINEKLPSNKDIVEACKINDMIVFPKDITNFLKIMSSIGVIRSSGSAKYVNKTKENAQESLRKHFNIE